MGRMLGKLHPHVWKSGPDFHRHHLFTACQRGRAQAKYRGEEWDINEAEFADFWMKDDRHLSRGRASADLCMTRIDEEKGWTLDNVEIVERNVQLNKVNIRKRGMKYV